MTLTLRSKLVEVKGPPPARRMPNGTVYVGISPHTGYPLYAAESDLPGYFMWHEAQKAAATCVDLGYCDWRVPTFDELFLLFHVRYLLAPIDRTCRYWTSAPHYLSSAWGFSMDRENDKRGLMFGKRDKFKVRLVRGLDPNVQA